ncbi:carbohydrate diacid transcriptional activator CdaR [Actinomadura rubteroloni]|uniref:Carbohydrate diacid transcriptional activator CdaR n=1 Tax=Actinomadura rubteroloni TaxID=1926885 RepID=A0A2P4UIA7_9ACTN|nr:PucR family transcriptional regulator [Actinomadura rubteroloni]POM24780.1 carbohydrate diacid transcriptional activator CdaR [Actinomadura rubteroloni]
MADDLQEVTERTAELLGAPATLEDRDFHLVAYAAHGTTIDPVRMESILHRRSTEAVRSRFERYGIARATGPVRIPADHAAGVLGRLCLPVRWNGVTYGYLWLLDDEERIDTARAASAAPLCERAGLQMARQARERGDLGLKLAELLSTDHEVRTRAAADVSIETPVAVAVLRAQGTDVLNPWQLPRSVLTTTWEGDHVLLVPLPGRDPSSVVARARSLLEERSSGPVTAGIHEHCASLTGVREAWQRARTAARATEPGTTRTWDSLGALRLLRWSDDTSLNEAILTEGITRLLTNATLTDTARLFLENAGAIKPTAESLGIHRQTLYHRLTRIEALTELDLTTGQDRLTLHLALTLSPHLTAP